MAYSNKDLVKRLRSRIRDFEDRKASAADLSREIYHVARLFDGDADSQLRRALERHGNRVASLVEQALSTHVHGKILEVVDQIEAELVERGL